MIEVKIKVLENGRALPLPSYATLSSAGVDLYAAIEKKIILRSMERIIIPTGISIALPDDYEAQVRPRSGLALKCGVTVLNSPGTIDADYRGEVKVCLINLGQGIFTINHGDRIAQMIVASISRVRFLPLEELSKTERGEGGFGSTGCA